MPDFTSGARHNGAVTLSDASPASPETGPAPAARPDPPTPRRARLRARLRRRPLLPPWLTSVLLVAVFIALPSLPFTEFRPKTALAYAVAVAAGMAIMVRRRWPIPVLLVATGLEIAFVALTATTDTASAGIVLFYCAARWTDRRRALTASIPLVAVYAAAVWWRLPIDERADYVFGLLFWGVLTVALGDWLRSRHERRAARDAAVATRLAESQRRLVEQRLRIARELHDVVAHQIAVINVQSAVAEHLVRTDPDGAAAALAHVRTSAGIVLNELGGLLQLLRADTDDTGRVPNPTLEDLDALVASFGPIGLRVERTDVGTFGHDVPEGVQLAVYRLVQEALTNAHRYGDGRAHLSFTTADGRLTVTISNELSARIPPRQGPGLGVIGMRERVMAVGGTLDVGVQEDGRFVVRARFPLGAGER